MPKQTTRPTRSGQVAGAQIKIGEVHNEALREYVVIVNQGTLPQPMGGWALATLRGERLYFFPDDAILPPGQMLTVHSGQGMPDKLHSPHDLLWTPEQVWNNRRDVAVLFDPDGWEVDRWAYPHARVLGSTARRRKQLRRDGETWRIVDEQAPEARTGWLRDLHPRPQVAGGQPAGRVKQDLTLK